MKNKYIGKNDPFNSPELEPWQGINSMSHMPMHPCTQEEYDLMQTHDPMTAYVITNSSEKKIYYGDQLANFSEPEVKFTMSIEYNDNGRPQYVISEVTHSGDGSIFIVPIETYDDIINADKSLKQYSAAGSGDIIDLKLYELLKDYIHGDTQLNSVILGIFTIRGMHTRSAFQQMVSLANLLYDRDTPTPEHDCNEGLIRGMQMYLDTRRIDSASCIYIKAYLDLYSIIKDKYDKLNKYRTRDLEHYDLRNVINDINKYMTRFICGNRISLKSDDIF